jgi:capsular polysaccharide biosynthesis protein
VGSILQGLGFETIYAEHLTLDEQISVFQEAKYVVALHGAGLVQQIFMNPATAHILEIMPRDYMIALY